MLHANQALLTAILSTAVDAIIVIDARGNIESINPATTRLFGYERDEMIGNNVKMLMPSPYREEHDGYLRGYQETGRAKIIGVGREVTGMRKDGSTFPIHLAVSEVALADRTLFAGIIRDISDLKRAQDELTKTNEQLEIRVEERTAELRSAQADLVQAEKLATLGQVSGGIAHEIRNPLNAVRTSAYFLRHAQNPSPEKTAEHLERIDRQVSLIDHVVTALSDVVHLPEPRVAETRIEELIDEVILTVSVPENIQVDNQVGRELPSVLVDANQISIVFRNLLRNACDSMPDGGSVRISSDTDDDQVIIRVADNGPGIEPNDVQRIVEPLYSTKPLGMGLGLAVSAAILDKNRAHFEVESEVGTGTIFSVALPTPPTERPT